MTVALVTDGAEIGACVVASAAARWRGDRRGVPRLLLAIISFRCFFFCFLSFFFSPLSFPFCLLSAMTATATTTAVATTIGSGDNT